MSASKVTPAAKSLGLLIRKAQWLGKGQAPERGQVEPELITSCDQLPASQDQLLKQNRPVAQTERAQEATKSEAIELPEESFSLAAAAVVETVLVELPAAAVPSGPSADTPAQVNEREAVLVFGEGKEARRWRVRGLPKNLAVGVLKVNVMVSNEGGGFHVDTLDLYAARARAAFVSRPPVSWASVKACSRPTWRAEFEQAHDAAPRALSVNPASKAPFKSVHKGWKSASRGYPPPGKIGP